MQTVSLYNNIADIDTATTPCKGHTNIIYAHGIIEG